MKKTTKRILSAMLALVLCATAVPFASAASIRGDVNWDGSVDSTDALVVLRYSVGYEVEYVDEYLFDVNGDYEVNSSDALRILMLAVDKDDPTAYSEKEILKYYADALYTSYLETTRVGYNAVVEGTIVNDSNPSQSTRFEEPYSEEFFFEDGYDEYGFAPEDYFVVPWIYEEGVANAEITETETGYRVKITLIEERTDLDDWYPPYNGDHAGFCMDYSIVETEEIWVEAANTVLPGSTIVANITNDGYVEDICFEVPFVADLTLAAYEVSETLDVTQSGMYTCVLSFDF